MNGEQLSVWKEVIKTYLKYYCVSILEEKSAKFYGSRSDFEC